MEKFNFANPTQQVQPLDRLVYLMTKDFNFASHLAQQIIHFGYFVQHVRDFKSLQNAIPEQNSVAILVDIPFNSDRSIEQDLFIEISKLQHASGNLIFISDYDDQIVRLKSIQSGGAAFFTKPVNIVGLIDKLDSLNRTSAVQKLSRVLIIEDQHAVASYYQMVLKMSGMDALIITEPGNVLEQLREFHPDLILMNIFMAGINAADLARVIRQIDDFVSIPIIFLSNEDDFGKRIEALDLGADDFLIKPIKASHLVAVVRSRIERSKTLRSYMVRDSLTNLLNHTAFRSILTQEVSRSRAAKLDVRTGDAGYRPF